MHNTIDYGFLEPVYMKALSMEFEKNKIRYVKKSRIDVFYKRKS
jgi:GxxExxY protein